MKRSRPLHTLITLALFVFAVSAPQSPVAAQEKPQRVHITILGTTDLHGNIYPIDYYTDKADNRGLAKIATLIKRVRKESPTALLIDSGDTIQGTPSQYYHNKKNNTPPDPMMLVMSSLHYDSMTVGNHEYNFGLQVLEKARSEAEFPWLSANTYNKGTETTHYKPYVVKEVSGVRVGILGLTTPGIPNWENVPNYVGLEFREPVAEAKKWVAELRNKEHVDIVVVAMHMGLEEDLRTGEINPSQVPNENRAVAIAREVPGVDAIFMGHTHRDTPAILLNGVLITQANHWGRHLVRADDIIFHAPKPVADDKVEPDAEVLKLAERYDAETQKWLARVVGESAAELSAKEARFRDTAILDLVQRVQLDAGKADVSMVAPFNLDARIAQGPVTVRNISGLYVYENTLVVLEVTGQQLKDALEHSAKFFRAYQAGKAPADLVDEKIPAYNFDIAEGVEYELDIRRPVGDRIQNLRFQGKPLASTQKLRLATNNYRVNGGGGYSMYKNAPVLSRSSDEIRELIIDWVERNKTIPTTPTNNWKLLP